jgi:hypothetical protein
VSTPTSVLRARLLDACRASAVAAQAGVAAPTWADAGTPRVFSGLAGMLGGRNRGRLPFVELDITGNGTVPLAEEGGTLQQRVIVRVHLGGTDTGAASDLSAAILGACIASIRSQAADNLTALGGEDIGELSPGPWGLQRDLTMIIEQSFSTDYGVT